MILRHFCSRLVGGLIRKLLAWLLSIWLAFAAAVHHEPHVPEPLSKPTPARFVGKFVLVSSTGSVTTLSGSTGATFGVTYTLTEPPSSGSINTSNSASV